MYGSTSISDIDLRSQSQVERLPTVQISSHDDAACMISPLFPRNLCLFQPHYAQWMPDIRDSFADDCPSGPELDMKIAIGSAKILNRAFRVRPNVLGGWLRGVRFLRGVTGRI